MVAFVRLGDKMKGKILNIILTVFLYLVLVAVLIILLVILDLFSGFTFIGRFHFGILKNVFLIIWGVGLIVPVFFCKKLSINGCCLYG